MNRRPSKLFLFALAAGCLADSVEYTPEQDIQAFDEIARTWSTPDGLTISLCEDPNGPGPDPDDTCQIEHVVRGDGSAPAHSEDRGGGCGGCPFANVAYVRGTLSGMEMPEAVTVMGTIHLGGAAGSGPYDYPYNVDLACEAPAMCGLVGGLEEDGTLTIYSSHGVLAADVVVALTPTSPASCPNAPVR